MIATYKKVRMDTLFPIDPGYPQGFSYVRDFIDQAEEELLLKAISEIELHTFLFQGYEAKRRVASFGYDTQAISQDAEANLKARRAGKGGGPFHNISRWLARKNQR